ncbi:hypothetical protein TSUD_302710 [Trifolium subterraneum]|uniref:Uncharacterized protein n=1 Tax=Trifolium subterraneum TaxID=3900 RepID=A0A2Z6PL08_TRISU|nr:hypothetical protein TSUD_302710 [Trifolium subterraneum]
MKNTLNKVPTARKKPTWIDSTVWDTLWEHWETSEFKKKRIQAKTNRASDCDGFAKPLHTCGSITTSQHRANLTELNGTPPTPSDLFVHTHQHRKNKTWVDGRSEHVYEKFKRRKTELTQEASSQGAPPPKEIDVWTEVAGIRKGHIYGLGSESSSYAGRRNYRGSDSASTEWVQSYEFEELKNEREETRIKREEMRRERDEMRRERDELRYMVKQLMESINFQPKPYTRDQVRERDVVDDNDNGMSNYNDDMANDHMSDDNDLSDYNDDVANDHMSDNVSDDGEELDKNDKCGSVSYFL